MVLDSSSDSHRSNRSSTCADSNSRLRQAASSAGAARTRSARFWLQAASQRASKAEVPSLAVKEDKRGSSSNSSSRSGGVSAWISRVVHKGAKRAAGKAANSHPKRSRNMACSRTVASAAEEAAVALGLQGVLARTRNARTKRG